MRLELFSRNLIAITGTSFQLQALLRLLYPLMWFWASQLDHFLVSDHHWLCVAFDVRSDRFSPRLPFGQNLIGRFVAPTSRCEHSCEREA